MPASWSANPSESHSIRTHPHIRHVRSSIAKNLDDFGVPFKPFEKRLESSHVPKTASIRQMLLNLSGSMPYIPQCCRLELSSIVETDCLFEAIERFFKKDSDLWRCSRPHGVVQRGRPPISSEGPSEDVGSVLMVLYRPEKAMQGGSRAHDKAQSAANQICSEQQKVTCPLSHVTLIRSLKAVQGRI